MRKLSFNCILAKCNLQFDNNSLLSLNTFEKKNMEMFTIFIFFLFDYSCFCLIKFVIIFSGFPHRFIDGNISNDEEQSLPVALGSENARRDKITAQNIGGKCHQTVRSLGSVSRLPF